MTTERPAEIQPDIGHVLAARALWRRFCDTKNDFDGDAQEAFIQIVAPILAALNEAKGTRDEIIEECARVLDKEYERLVAYRYPGLVAMRDCAVLIRALKNAAPQAPASSEGGERPSPANEVTVEDVDRALSEAANSCRDDEQYYLHGLWKAREIIRALRNAAPGRRCSPPRSAS